MAVVFVWKPAGKAGAVVFAATTDVAGDVIIWGGDPVKMSDKAHGCSNVPELVVDAGIGPLGATGGLNTKVTLVVAFTVTVVV